ncbi:CHAT domain-containing protein [Kribbella sp. C-35]|uniref:CHAT domain-containing protein n=1 Tax=Kribbella sp. C-35 TaxID=2789276 RepID=UPI00397B7E76
MAVDRDAIGLAVAGTALVAILVGRGLQVALLIVAGSLGVWAAAAVCAVDILVLLANRYYVPRGKPGPPDEGALVGGVRSLPSELLRLLAEEAAAAGGVVDTAGIVRSAIRSDPLRWGSVRASRVPVRRGSEGGVVADVGWTFCAAEAALVARCLTLPDGRLDVHGLAAAAVAVPNSAGGTRPEIVSQATSAAGVGPRNLIEAMARASAMPGGELLLPRVELSDKSRSGNKAAAELDDAIWLDLRAVGRPAASPATQPQKDAATIRVTTAETVAVKATTESRKPRNPDRVRGSDSSRVPDGKSRKVEPDRTTGLGRIVAQARDLWPPWALLVWWVVRPLCTLGALTVCIGVATTGRGLLQAMFCAVIVILVRPVGSVWLGLAATGATALLVPAAGVLVGIRFAAGALVLLLVGRGWARGRQSLVGLRQRVVGEAGLPQAWDEPATALRNSRDFDLVDKAVATWLAAWSAVDFKAITRSTANLLRGALFGRWPSGPTPGLEAAVAWLAFLESVLGLAVRAVAATGTFLVVWLVLPAPDHRLLGFGVPSWIGAAFAAGLAQSIVKAGPFSGRLATLGFWCLATLLATGQRAGVDFGVALAFGIVGRGAGTKAQAPLVVGRRQSPRRPGGLGTWKAREYWHAACRASETGRLDIARKLWSDLASNHQQATVVRAGAWAGLAVLELNDGDLQKAVDHTRRALALTRPMDRSRYSVYATSGMVLLAAGNAHEARRMLNDAMGSRRVRRDPGVAATRAELLALERDPQAALSLLEHSAAGLLRTGRLEQIVATEVAIVSHLLGTVAAAELEERLGDLLLFDFDSFEFDEPAARRLTAVVARAHLVMGRVRLERGALPDAAASFRRSASDLSQPRDKLDQAIARVLLGVASSRSTPEEALAELRAGIEQLETLRGALRAGEHRSNLVGRHTTIYEKAYDALVHIQRTEPSAGLLAAELTESLRRSALAQTLRHGGLEMPPPARSLITQISELEKKPIGDVDDELLRNYRDQLGDLLSTTFANAYLPSGVDFADLRSRVGRADILSYRVHLASPDELRGHVVWTSPGRCPFVAPFRIDSEPILEILGLRGTPAREHSMTRMSLRVDAGHWRQLGDALVPHALQSALLAADNRDPGHLVVVPDDKLAVLPWPALRLADGRFLVELASVQLVPTLDLLEARSDSRVTAIRRPNAESDPVLVYLDAAVEQPAERYEVTGFNEIILARELGEIINALRSRRLSGAYIAAHGDGIGLGQYLSVPGSGRLSAATALSLPWPDWTIFASCLVGRLEILLGKEPIGLPISCLIGGANSVIGGVVEIQGSLSGQLAPKVASQQRSCKHAADALRDAQLAYLGTPARPAAPYRWAGLACFARTLPARCFDAARTTF